jgi:hypothetical protein
MTDEINKNNPVSEHDVGLATQDSRANEHDDFLVKEDDQDNAKEEGFVPRIISENYLAGLNELNAERDSMFGLSEPKDLPQNTVDTKVLIEHAKKFGVGNLLALVKDALWQLGYKPSFDSCLIHNKSGNIIKL